MQSERCSVVIIARVAVPSRCRILLTCVRVQRIDSGVASKILQLLTMLSSVTFSRFLLFLLIFHLVVRLNYFHLHCVSLLSVSHPPLFMSIPITSGVWFISVEVGILVWLRLNFSPSCSKAQSSNSDPDRLCLPTFFVIFLSSTGKVAWLCNTLCHGRLIPRHF